MKSREKILRLLSENNTLTTATHASVGGGEDTKKGQILRLVLFGSGERTRTSDLRVMSPTSYQLLYPAMLDYKSTDIF